ncbi:piggyBac transposable element-derived protein 3-like [Rhopalosiphum padi]|uniref:piggyBac transposable element-derived protein 3-like n=1 Tax=Rhopalosiphum padi TaxID=40932 RepID=UPI00298D703B|nr:piggyBac transposable element-derived protein 3-like [Rhopalosiphum padi]
MVAIHPILMNAVTIKFFFYVNEFEVDAINWDELDVLQRELEIADNSNDQDLNSVKNGCLQLISDTHLSIDEQIIPFTGSTRLIQYVKGKPNPEGLKNFVLADKNGLVLDIFIYQGKKTTIDHDDCEFSLTLAESVVWHLSETVPPKTCLYFDRYFTTEKLVQILLKKNFFSTGTVMKNHLPKNITLMSDKAMMKSNRGTSKQYVREDKKMVLVKWFDNKPIHLLSSESDKEPKDTCRRWSKKEFKKIDVERPNCVKNYNTFMGGVDLCDRMIAHY